MTLIVRRRTKLMSNKEKKKPKDNPKPAPKKK
jgi:hypothetical protein